MFLLGDMIFGNSKAMLRGEKKLSRLNVRPNVHGGSRPDPKTNVRLKTHRHTVQRFFLIFMEGAVVTIKLMSASRIAILYKKNIYG